MRFTLIFKLKAKEVPSDYRRRFISFLKQSFEDYNQTVFAKYYKDKDNIEKPYTFSVYFGKAVFSKERITLENDQIYFKFSTFDTEAGLHFYNSVLAKKGNEFYLEDGNYMVLEEINLVKEKLIINSHAVFKTLSPILIREHNKETNKDWYYSFDDEESLAILKNSMKYQAVNYFGSSVEKDVEEIEIKFLNMKKLVINHYGIFVTGNVGTFEMQGNPYLLEYFYKAGVAAKKSEGFGLCDVIK